jgi:hypothetical protein
VHAQRMGKPTKLQGAGRSFLLRLIAEHGLAGATRVLRALADEIEVLASSSKLPAKFAFGASRRLSGSKRGGSRQSLQPATCSGPCPTCQGAVATMLGVATLRFWYPNSQPRTHVVKRGALRTGRRLPLWAY